MSMSSSDRVSEDMIEDMLHAQERSEEEAPRVPFKPYDIVVLLVFIALFGVVFLQFFTRYALNDSISWTEEAARYLLICLAFIGCVKCQILDSHIRLEVIDQVLGDKIKYLKVFSLALILGFSIFCTWSTWELIQRTSFQSMISLPFPKYYLYAVIIVALIAMSLVCALQLYVAVRRAFK
ncbi:MAG: TRAP transporter small permease [Oceanicola sp.]|nr:TRAP transporter small permease [Oceanicola sp.]